MLYSRLAACVNDAVRTAEGSCCQVLRHGPRLRQESEMGTILADALLGVTGFQWVCIILLIVVLVGYFVWKKKQE